MSLTRRIELILIVLLLVMAAASVAAYRFVVYESFLELEAADEIREIERVQGTILQDVTNLETITGDWSSWDDTYFFMEDKFPNFIHSNLQDSTFEFYRLNAIVFLDPEGEVHYSDLRNYQTHEPIKIPEFESLEWRRQHLMGRSDVNDYISGIVQTEAGPMLLASLSILKSDETGPSNGSLIFGRLMTDEVLGVLEAQANRHFDFLPIDYVQGSAFSSNSGYEVKQLDGITKVTMAIYGVHDKPEYVVVFGLPRLISQQGQVAFNSFIGILFLALLVTLAAIRWFMQREVIQSLLNLKEKMQGISSQEQLPNSIEIDRNDEIGDLAEEFERMLKRLIQDQSLKNEALLALQDNLADARRAEKLAKLGSYEWDWVANRMVSCSEEFARLHGSSIEEVLEQRSTFDSDMDFIHPEDRDQYLKIENAAIANQQASYSTSYRLLLEDGQVFHIRDTCEVEYDEYGAPIRSRGTTHDVSAFIELEEQLRQAQKLEAIGQLSGGIAHDFNNLLVVILGNIELSRRLLDGNHPSLGLLQASQEAAEKAKELTERLLAFGRKQPLKLVDVDIQKLVASMEGLLRRSVGDRIQIDIHAGADTWIARTDVNQLESAILNLAINARDAMPMGGVLIVDFSRVSVEEAPTKDNELQPGDYICISIKDSGIGIPTEIMEHVFEPFYTTKGVGEGTGLGLSMVYGLMKQSGGHVTLESNPGSGTTVRLFLQETELQSEAADTSESDQPKGRGEKVLVVEDDDSVRQLVSIYLDELEYDTCVAADASEALEHLHSGAEFKLLFSDVVLPGDMNGVDLAQHAKEVRPGIKVLLTSGYPREILNNVDYRLLKKPYNQNQLAHSLREALAATA